MPNRAKERHPALPATASHHPHTHSLSLCTPAHSHSQQSATPQLSTTLHNLNNLQVSTSTADSSIIFNILSARGRGIPGSGQVTKSPSQRTFPWTSKWYRPTSLGGSVGAGGGDAFPWGAWPRDAAVDTHKQAGRQSTALTGASLHSCHVTKRFSILATLKQGNKSMYSNTSGYVHMGLRLDWGKGVTGQ